MARPAEAWPAGVAWPFTGRRRELGLIAEAVRNRAGSCLLIAGAEGVGKTRLARQALVALADGGWETAATVAADLAARTPPPGASPSSRVDARIRPASDHIAWASAASGTRAGRPMAVLVDDAHLLDETSAPWIIELIHDEDVFLVLTSCVGQLSATGFTRLWRDGRLARVDLDPLGGDDLDSLLRAVLGGRIDGGARAELTRLAGGSLLVLRELLDAALKAASLAFDGCSWRLSGRAPIPPSLHEHVGGSIEELSAAERRLLEFVALGEPLEVGLLEAVAGTCASVASPATALVAVAHDQRRAFARLTRPLFGQVLRADTPPLVARAVCRQLADALAATGARRAGDRVRLAVWRLNAGQAVDHELLAQGARQAMRDHDPATAQRLARASADRERPRQVTPSIPQPLLAHSRDAVSPTASVGRVGGSTSYDDNEEGDSQHAAIPSAVPLAEGGAAPEMVRHAEHARRPSPEGDEVTANRASMALRAGHAAHAVDLAGSVLSRSDPAWLDPLRPLAVSTAALALLGRPDDALALASGKDGGPPSGEDSWLAAITATRVLWDALWFSGRLDEAETVARCGFEAVMGTGTEALRPLVAFHLGLVARARGQVRTALGWLEDASSLARHGDRFGLQIGILAAIAHCAAQAGEIDVARRALSEAEAAQPRMAMAEVRIRRSAAWVLASEGQLVRARKEAVTAADVAGECGLRSLEAMALYDAARMGFAPGVAARVALVTVEAQGALLRAIGDHVEALSSGDTTALDAASARFEELGMVLDAAEAASAAARAHLGAGDRAAAARSRERARRLALRCERAHTPLLVEHGAAELVTEREREVAELAASGLRSAEIAARLGISMRTVDSHLLRVYAKLGVRGRRDLGQVFGPQSPSGPSPKALAPPQ